MKCSRTYHVSAAGGGLQVHQRLLRRLLAELGVAAGACEPYESSLMAGSGLRKLRLLAIGPFLSRANVRLQRADT